MTIKIKGTPSVTLGGETDKIGSVVVFTPTETRRKGKGQHKNVDDRR